MRRCPALVVVLGVLVASPVCYVATAQQSAPRVAGAVLPWLSEATPVRAVDTRQSWDVSVSLARPHVAEEERLVLAQQRGQAPALTPQELAGRFAVDSQTARRATSWLTREGLTATTSRLRDVISLHGTVGQVQRTFGTTLWHYTLAGRSFVAADRAPLSPPAATLAISHLDTWTRFTAGAKGLRTAQSGCSAGVCRAVVTARDLWSVYDQPPGTTGQAERVAVLGSGATDTAIRSLRLFEKANGLPRTAVRVMHAGKGSFTDTSADFEWALDVQAVAGMAPGLDGIDLYFGSDLNNVALLSAVTAWVEDPYGAHQANASWGSCEADPVDDALAPTGRSIVADSASGMFQDAMDAQLRKAVLQGRTLFAAAGDSGASCFALGGSEFNGQLWQVVPLTLYPASSPYAVGVGGTVLQLTPGSHPKRVSEKAWTYTGGGPSMFQARPAWQRGTTELPCVLHHDGSLAGAGTTCRGVPDVAALSGGDSDPPDVHYAGVGNDVFPTYNHSYSCESVGCSGTSLAAPLWAGMWARVQATAPSRRGLGFAAPRLYAAAARAPQAFYDVTEGSNGTWRAGPGWDYVSGLGTPDLTRLARALTGRVAAVRAGHKDPVRDVFAIRCNTSGSTSDPTGDAVQLGAVPADSPTGSDPAYDMTRAWMSYDARPRALVFHARVPGLAAPAAGQSQQVRFYLTYEGDSLVEARAVRGSDGATTYNLYSSEGQIASLRGSFDQGRKEISVALPLATFNRAFKPAHPWRVGTAIANWQAYTQRVVQGTGFTADETRNEVCAWPIG